MTLAEQVYQTVKPLPEAKVQEVLDFALFLQQREAVTNWDNAEFTEMNDEQNTQQLLERIKNIKRVSAPYSSEILVRELRHEKTISPITQSLIGLLANSNLDEADYKKHLEDKYL
jgi:hypothetical protein